VCDDLGCAGGNDLQARSAYGPANPWLRRANKSGAGRIRAGGIERDTTFTEAASQAHAAIDAARQAKYTDTGPRSRPARTSRRRQAAAPGR
jgi:hypothetical protein